MLATPVHSLYFYFSAFTKCLREGALWLLPLYTFIKLDLMTENPLRSEDPLLQPRSPEEADRKKKKRKN